MFISLNKHPCPQLSDEVSATQTNHRRTSTLLVAIPTTTLSTPKSVLYKTNTNVILLSLAISLLAIGYPPVQESIFILCDSGNHHTRPVQQSSPERTNTAVESSERLQPKDAKNDINGNNNSNNRQFISRGDVYFLISEPESLRYTFKARSSKIGVPFNSKFSNIALVLAEPRDACASTINKLEIKGNIALVERGGCSFLEKCIEIERSGGIALIVYDYDKHNDENYIEMIDDNTSRNCSIPAVSLLGKDGYMIVHSLLALKLNRAVITIPINVARDEVSNPPWLMW